MRKALVKRGGQIIEVDIDDNHVNQLRKAKTGLQVSKSTNDPCPPDFYWDEDEGKCVPMSATLPKREELYTNPKMLKDLQRLNNKRRVNEYKKHYTKTRDSFWNENFKGPYIDENGQKEPDRNSPEFINYKKLSDERFKDMPNPWFDKNFKLPEDFKKKDFYPKDGEWDEDSKKEFNEFFNTEPTEQEKEQIIWKEYHKNNSTSPSFEQRDIPQDDPSLQYKMNPDDLRQYRYDEEWCPCYKTKEELIAGRMVTKKVCVPCEQAKMGGSLAKFMQDGGEGSKYPLNDMGEEIRYRKEFDRRGKRITKEKLVTPPNEEEGERGSTRYVKRVLDDSGQGRMTSRPSGIDYFINPFRANFTGEPRYGGAFDTGINPNFNWHPQIYQMGGEPQNQMAQQSMPPQQEGQAQGSEQDQIMRLIQAYAEAMGISPEEIIQELQQMNPQEQKQAIDQMAQELQGGQQAQAPEQQMSPEQMMQMGGANNIYTPDTGTEQYAPDPSWYDGGDRVAAPGNVVSWPSYPEGGRPSNIPLYNSVPIEEQIIRRDPRKTGITTFNRYPSIPEREYDDSSYIYEDNYNPVRRVPFFENIADRVGDGFDNVGDFFKRLKRRRGGRRGGRMRGNGLLNCKPGTKCFKFQEGGDLQNDSPLDKFTAEHKNQNFANLVQEFGQMNYDKAFSKDLANDFKKFQAGGYITDADGNQQYSLGHNFNFNNAYRLQQEANNRDKNANTGEAFWKLFGTAMNSAQKLKSGMSGIGGGGAKAPTSKPASAPVASATPTQTPTPAATTPAAPAPAAGAAPAATPAASGNPLGALSSILGGGGGGAASALGGMDLSALAGFLRYGGNVPTAQNGGILGKVLPAAAGIVGTALAGPVGGIAAKTVASGIAGGGKGTSGGGGGGFDPSALMSFLGKYGGSLPRYQINGQVGAGLGSLGEFGDQFINNNKGATGSSVAPFSDVYKSSFGESKEPLYFSENTELPPVEPDNSVEAWRKQMQDNSAVTEDGKNWDPLKFNKEDIEKYNLDPTQNNITQKKEKLGFQGFMQATKGMGLATAGFLEAWGNRDKARKAQNKADMALLSDHSSKATTADMLDKGDYVTNAQPNDANFQPDKNLPMGPFGSRITKYGAQIAKEGTQVQNPYMSNPYSHPEAILYGEPDPKVSNTLKPVKREDANLEAEIGEVAVTPAGPDGVPKFFKIGGKNHYDGGTPLSLPENTFIFSKTRSMIIKDPKILKELTGSTKPATPADLAKRFDYSDYVAVLQNENSDPVERKTAQMMIESMMYKLGQIAIIQEAKKGFPSGIPLVAVPYLEKAGIDPQMLLPQTEEEPQEGDSGIEQQMDPRMMQEQMEPMPEEMMMPPMARYGGSNLERYQKKGQVSNSALLNRISKDIKTYPREINTDSANKYLPWKNSDAIENYPLIYNTDSLRKYLPWNNEVPEDSSIFDNYNPEFRMTPYQIGGTNIMGGPVLPIYQNAGQFDDLNFAQKVLSGKNPITNQTPTAKKESGAYMPEAWGIYAKAMNSRDIEEIKKAAEYMENIDVPYNLGWMPWQTEQDTFENAAGALYDRASMLENDATQASISSKQFEEKKQLSDFRNKLMELKKSTPNTLENIDKIKKINTALKETSAFSFENGIYKSIGNWGDTYKSPLSLINAYQSLFTNSSVPNNKKEKVVSTTKMSADSTAKSTPAPVQVPAQQKSSKSSVSKSQTKNIVTFGPNDQSDIKIIQQPQP